MAWVMQRNFETWELMRLKTAVAYECVCVCVCVMMVMMMMVLQTANWMISYLLKAYLIKLIETDAIEKRIYYILSSLLHGHKDFMKWLFTLIV